MDIIIKKSEIHNKGAFAGRNFKKGEVIVDWATCSIRITKTEVNRMPESQKHFVSYLGRGVWVKFRSPGKYFNHSCEANTKAVRGRDIAKRDIKRGEELTADYIAEKVPVFNLKCRCGAAGCKRMFNPRTLKTRGRK